MAVGGRNKSLTYGEVLPSSIEADVLPALARPDATFEALAAAADAAHRGGSSSGRRTSVAPSPAAGGGGGGGSGTVGRRALGRSPSVASLLPLPPAAGPQPLADDVSTGDSSVVVLSQPRSPPPPRAAGHRTAARTPRRVVGAADTVPAIAGGGSSSDGGGGSSSGDEAAVEAVARVLEPAVPSQDLTEGYAPNLPNLPLSPTDVAYDLGSGTAKIALQTALQTAVALSKGVEYAASRHAVAARALRRLIDTPIAELAASAARYLAAAGKPTEWAASIARQLKWASRRTQAIHGSFLEVDITDATVVFINNTVFEATLMVPLLDLLATSLPRLRRVLVLRRLCARHSGLCRSRGYPCAAFYHPPLESKCCPTWDLATTTFTYMPMPGTLSAGAVPAAPPAAPPAPVASSAPTPTPPPTPTPTGAPLSAAAALLTRDSPLGEDTQPASQPVPPSPATRALPGVASPAKRPRWSQGEAVVTTAASPVDDPSQASSSAGGERVTPPTATTPTRRGMPKTPSRPPTGRRTPGAATSPAGPAAAALLFVSTATDEDYNAAVAATHAAASAAAAASAPTTAPPSPAAAQPPITASSGRRYATASASPAAAAATSAGGGWHVPLSPAAAAAAGRAVPVPPAPEPMAAAAAAGGGKPPLPHGTPRYQTRGRDHASTTASFAVTPATAAAARAAGAASSYTAGRRGSASSSAAATALAAAVAAAAGESVSGSALEYATTTVPPPATPAHRSWGAAAPGSGGSSGAAPASPPTTAGAATPAALFTRRSPRHPGLLPDAASDVLHSLDTLDSPPPASHLHHGKAAAFPLPSHMVAPVPTLKRLGRRLPSLHAPSAPAPASP